VQPQQKNSKAMRNAKNLPYIDKFERYGCVCPKCGRDTEDAVIPRGEDMGTPAQWCEGCQVFISVRVKHYSSPLPCRYCKRYPDPPGKDGMVHHACETIAFHLPEDEWNDWAMN
jgi:hypothetical protein